MQAEVGFVQNERTSEYMENKFQIESDWIVPALMTNWADYI